MDAASEIGMTRMITAALGTLGQELSMRLMFIGRVGPLALVYIFATAIPGHVQNPRAEI